MRVDVKMTSLTRIMPQSLFTTVSSGIRRVVESSLFFDVLDGLSWYIMVAKPATSAPMLELVKRVFVADSLFTQQINLVQVAVICKTLMVTHQRIDSALFTSLRKYFLEPVIGKKAHEIMTKSLDNKSMKRALIVNSIDDPNGYFTTCESFLSELEQLAISHSIQQLLFYTEGQAQEALNSLGDKMDLVWIRAHGNPNKIRLSSSLSLSEKSEKTMKQIGNRLLDGGTLILDSCRTGKGMGNIASVFSKKCPHVTVYAPSSTIQSGSLQFSQEEPAFYVRGRNQTSVYKAGCIMKSKGRRGKLPSISECVNILGYSIHLYCLFSAARTVYRDLYPASTFKN